MSKSDYLFINGTVYTSASQTVNATAIATSGNRIVFIGETADAIKQKNSAAEIIDLRGKFVLPGFVDAHMHRDRQQLKKCTKYSCMILTTNQIISTVLRNMFSPIRKWIVMKVQDE